MQITGTKKTKYFFLVLLCALLVGAGGLLLASEASQAQMAPQEVSDANCPGPRVGTVGVVPTVARAQTFTAINSGKLTSAEVQLFQSFPNSGDLTMEIRNVDASGAPTDTILASVTIPSDQIPDAPPTATLTFAFDPANAATVMAGQQYALVLQTTAGQYSISIARNPSCLGSEYDSERGGPFRENDLYDLIFAVFVTPDQLPALTPQPNQGQPHNQNQPQRGGAPIPITQEGEQESEAGEIDQSFDVS